MWFLKSSHLSFVFQLFIESLLNTRTIHVNLNSRWLAFSPVPHVSQVSPSSHEVFSKSNLGKFGAPSTLFLAALGLRCHTWAFSSCSKRRPLSSFGARARAQQLWGTGFVAPRHLRSSWTRDGTHILWTGRQVLNHWTTREALETSLLDENGTQSVTPAAPSLPSVSTPLSAGACFFALVHLKTTRRNSLIHLPLNKGTKTYIFLCESTMILKKLFNLTVKVSNYWKVITQYLTYMQSTSWETLGWMKHKLE